jgi:two-component system NtrC family sensor kinase
VRLELEMGPSTLRLRCDHALIEQALINLLLNACEASRPAARVWLRVSQDADRVRFTVEDEGEGISPAFLMQNHEPFRTTKPDGTGLGLAITAEIVAHHGGELSLTRREPRGTRAVVELPVQELSG